jgi:hypothetical protein
MITITQYILAWFGYRIITRAHFADWASLYDVLPRRKSSARYCPLLPTTIVSIFSLFAISKIWLAAELPFLYLYGRGIIIYSNSISAYNIIDDVHQFETLFFISGHSCLLWRGIISWNSSNRSFSSKLLLHYIMQQLQLPL